MTSVEQPATESGSQPAPSPAPDAAAPAANAQAEASANASVRGPIEPSAQLLGWVMLAAVNAVFITRLSRPPAGWQVRAVHHLYDAALLVGVGLLVSAACEAWRRWGPRRALWGYLLLAALAIACGFFTLDDDFFGFSIDFGGSWSGVLLAAVVVVAALVVPAAARLGALLARPRLRWVGAAAGAALAIANELILDRGYPAIHLYAAVAAATLFGTSLGNGWVWERLRTAPPITSRLLLAARGALALAAAAAAVVVPGQAALVELYRLDGQVIAPRLGELHAAIDAPAIVTTTDAGDWFADRSGHPAIAPTSPPLIPSDSIVILVTADSVLARVLRDEANRPKLPNLFSLRDRGVDFVAARAPASGTTTTLASLFACRYLSQLKWSVAPGMKRDTPYTDDSIRLPQALAKGNIRSVHFVSYPPLIDRYGIGRGFSDEIVLKASAGQRFALSSAVIPAMIERLKKQRRGPLFMFAHLMDPHHPHDTGSQEGELFDRYVGEIAVVDHWMGELEKAIAELGVQDRTVLVFSADHGEGFGMHDTPHHNINLYEELLRVPLIMLVPGVAPRKVEENVTLLDLPPTFLDLWGQPTPGTFMGQSLVPILRGQPAQLTRPIAAEIPGKQAMVFGRTKLIRDRKKGTMELYDLDADPNEANNVFDQSGPEAKRQGALLDSFFRVHKRMSGSGPKSVD